MNNIDLNAFYESSSGGSYHIGEVNQVAELLVGVRSYGKLSLDVEWTNFDPVVLGIMSADFIANGRVKMAFNGTAVMYYFLVPVSFSAIMP